MWGKLKRWRWALAIVGLLVIGLGVAFWPEAVLVDTAKVSRGYMAVGVTDDGVTRAQEYYVVSAPLTGYLSRIELEPGDAVARGTVVTTMSGRPSAPLDPRSSAELRGSLAAARAAESGANASLAQSRRDLSRAEQLAGRGFLPHAQLESARTRVASDDALLQQSRAGVRRIEAMLAQPSGAAAGAPVPVRAPAGGSVLSVINESEGVITEGTQLMTIGDPRQIEAVVDLLSREAVRVHPGDRVEITEWGGPEPLIGYVKRIEPFGKLKVSALGIEEQRVNVIVGFDPVARDAWRLGHGYQIDATIVLWSRKDALRVPIGALFRGADGAWHAFVVDGGRVRERRLKIGHLSDEFAEVLEGLAEGETIVTNPGNSLGDGVRIALRQP